MANLNDEFKNVNYINLKTFYVYELRDPRTNAPFYVGKGKNNRIDMHEIEAEKIKQNIAPTNSDLDDSDESDKESSEKVKQINYIKAAGFDVVKIIVGRFETEGEALMVESVLIKWVYGFDNLTNVVHGHSQKFVRPFEQKQTGEFKEIDGIDRPRSIAGIRDGRYTEKKREQISSNSIYEKLESLRDDLNRRAAHRQYNVGDPDLSVPQDPCIMVSGFDDAIQLQVKMQLTGETVVFNLIPVDREQANEFKEVLTTKITEPYTIKKGNRFKYYTQSHDFSTKAGGLVKGISYKKVELILTMIDEIISRIKSRKP